MSRSLTRQQRRAFERHAVDNEPTIAADARFFERRPDRTYRVRRASRAELAQISTAYDSPVYVDQGSAAFTVVKKMVPGVRLRIFVPGPEDEDGTDAPDALGAFLWERYIKQHPAIGAREIAMRNAYERIRAEAQTKGSGSA